MNLYRLASIVADADSWCSCASMCDGGMHILDATVSYEFYGMNSPCLLPILSTHHHSPTIMNSNDSSTDIPSTSYLSRVE